MTVFNGAIHYEDVVAGSRVVGTRDAANIIPKYEAGVRDTSQQNTGYVRNLSLIGSQKRQAITAISQDTVIGAMVPTQAQDSTRQYKIIPGETSGKRHQRLVSDDMITVDPTRGQRIAKVLTGVGAFGIGYNPTPNTPEAKPIRKYPRDWHGDNMH